MDKKVIRGDGWSLTISGEKLLMNVGRASRPFRTEMAEAFSEIAHELERRVKRRMTDYRGGRQSRRSNKAPVQVRTGKLRQSVVGESKGDVAILRAGNRSVPYAATQEFGNPNLRAKPPKKFLRIPLPYVLTPAGDTRGKYQIYNRGGQWVTGAGQPTFIRGRAIMIVEGGKARALYALKESVSIPGRLGMGTTIDNSGPMIRKQIIAGVNRALRLEKGR